MKSGVWYADVTLYRHTSTDSHPRQPRAGPTKFIYKSTLEVDYIPRPDVALELRETLIGLKILGQGLPATTDFFKQEFPYTSGLSLFQSPTTHSCKFFLSSAIFIEASVSSLQHGAEKDRSHYGQALAGAILLVYTDICGE